MAAQEINFDALVGQTHNYAGLSEGNVASMANRDAIAQPKLAALQGLTKMATLASMGLGQGVLPPHERPFIPALRALGFAGTDRAIWEQVWTNAPRLAREVAASSAMWAANAATVSPSADCGDGRLHVTPANLTTMLHRSLETATTSRALARLLTNDRVFALHDALPGHPMFADEGAANQMRLSSGDSAPGVELFVYGREGDEVSIGYPARQSAEASRAIARLHNLNPAQAVFIRQSRTAILAGVFHNDVVAVAHESVLLFHERAFDDKKAALDAIRRAAGDLFEPAFIEVPATRISLTEAVRSYLFNAQLVRPPGAARLVLILPEEAKEQRAVAGFLAELVASNGPIGETIFVPLRQSMRNGGGPACLRLRIEMKDDERAAATPGFFWSDALAQDLRAWVERHYRDELAPTDLRDPALIDECHAALEALTQILPLGSDFYDFQRV